MKILKMTGPSMEPWGTPARTSIYELRLPLMFTDCFLPLRYDKKNCSAFFSKPYADNLAMRSSCGIQSNALDRP